MEAIILVLIFHLTAGAIVGYFIGRNSKTTICQNLSMDLEKKTYDDSTKAKKIINDFHQWVCENRNSLLEPSFPIRVPSKRKTFPNYLYEFYDLTENNEVVEISYEKYTEIIENRAKMWAFYRNENGLPLLNTNEEIKSTNKRFALFNSEQECLAYKRGINDTLNGLIEGHGKAE